MALPPCVCVCVCVRPSLVSLPFLTRTPVILQPGPTLINTVNMHHLSKGPVSKYSHFGSHGFNVPTLEGNTIQSVTLRLTELRELLLPISVKSCSSERRNMALVRNLDLRNERNGVTEGIRED